MTSAHLINHHKIWKLSSSKRIKNDYVQVIPNDNSVAHLMATMAALWKKNQP